MITRTSIIIGLVNMITGMQSEKCYKRLERFSNQELAEAYYKATGNFIHPVLHDTFICLNS